ncbi:helix-turn-helix domain-containing protein [Lederbergia wuyishanensis]|uniref:Transcriptional regulator with XRE-family HTH domain n=1 Tax=Lederbergia wuyishanensis TaxID=1347903 RepID=A0ABU0D4J2_9BACI|nr:helix-turn-helix transcriptional regulator [Lederbergia wuyishanensis]MCJ8008087.1 helix-turn-helix transcriptional regulator [Lederbergia wuyishanensis]MDQ0343328.1 transcriptional regulator with XRE-family HTH domain [Lederbergia wuyishanensis]
MFDVGRCRLNEILQKKKMTQVDLAFKVGMKKQQINAYANNETIMSYRTAKNISYHLDVKMEDLYDFIRSEEQ